MGPWVFILLISKKPGLSHEEFKRYHEEVYMPAMKELCGPVFPLAHIRRYIAQNAEDARKHPIMGLPALLVGKDDEIGWDCLAEITFKDELHFQQFFARINEQDVADQILEHESNFSDISKLKFIIMEAWTTVSDNETTRLVERVVM